MSCSNTFGGTIKLEGEKELGHADIQTTANIYI